MKSLSEMVHVALKFPSYFPGPWLSSKFEGGGGGGRDLTSLPEASYHGYGLAYHCVVLKKKLLFNLTSGPKFRLGHLPFLPDAC